jgi:hypothetical protein
MKLEETPVRAISSQMSDGYPFDGVLDSLQDRIGHLPPSYLSIACCSAGSAHQGALVALAQSVHHRAPLRLWLEISIALSDL